MTFTNVGDTPHTATAFEKGIGVGYRRTGQGRVEDHHLRRAGIYYYICTPHPWMYGQVIVE